MVSEVFDEEEEEGGAFGKGGYEDVFIGSMDPLPYRAQAIESGDTESGGEVSVAGGA